MSDGVSVVQKAPLGSNPTMIAEQKNYHGISPKEASQLAIDLFMENFPKLKEAALETARARVNELIGEIVREIEEKHNHDYSAFSTPDMQYILLQAESGYARRGTKELCAMLSSLVANRSACRENNYLEVILDRAIEIAPLLQPIHLDYLSLIFVYKHVKFGRVKTLEDLQKQFQNIHNCLKTPKNINEVAAFINILGLTVISLGSATEVLSKCYGFSERDVEAILPAEHKLIHGDYGLSPIGYALAIFNARFRLGEEFDLDTWIQSGDMNA